MRIKFGLFCFLAALALPLVLFAKDARVSELDLRCKTIHEQVKAKKLALRIFADMNIDPMSSEEKWQEFKSEKALRDETCFTAASVYAQNGHILLAAFMFSSESGDWCNYVDYYFYDNGAIAKSESDLRRFGAFETGKIGAGHFLVEVLRDWYYDTTGAKVFTSEPRYFNLSKKPRAAVENVEFAEGYWPEIKNVKALPFYKILEIHP